jgi:hypothetical protein
MTAPTVASDDITRGVDACLSYIRQMRGGVSLVEIRKVLENAGLEVRGQIAVTMPDDPNIVWWAGMSQVFADVMVRLLDTRVVELQPTSVLTYLVDGQILNFPIVRGRPPKGGYKKVHWLPETYNLCAQEPAIKRQPKRKERVTS